MLAIPFWERKRTFFLWGIFRNFSKRFYCKYFSYQMCFYQAGSTELKNASIKWVLKCFQTHKRVLLGFFNVFESFKHGKKCFLNKRFYGASCFNNKIKSIFNVWRMVFSNKSTRGIFCVNLMWLECLTIAVFLVLDFDSTDLKFYWISAWPENVILRQYFIQGDMHSLFHQNRNFFRLRGFQQMTSFSRGVRGMPSMTNYQFV